MPVFVAKEITAVHAGQRIEAVTCTKCATQFYYELTRLGVGKGTAPYYLGQHSASNRADAAAERDLEKRLNQEAELVPCPKCHWVNEDLVERYRRRQYRRAPLLIGIILAAGFVAGPIIWAGLTEALEYNSRVPARVALGVTIGCLLSPAWILFIRAQLRRRIDPNATYPRRPTVPLGTPPALVEQRAPRGEMRLVPVARRSDGSSDREWAMFRPGQVRFPPVCCICLEKATTVYGSPLKMNEGSDLEVPLCSTCDAQLQRRWWRNLFVVAVAILALTGMLVAAIPGIDAFGRWALFIIFGAIGSLVGSVIIASVRSRPYRIAVVDKDRGIVKFSASNSGYTALLIEQVRVSNDVASR